MAGDEVSTNIIDISTLPSGKRYEDQYGKFLDIFKQVAESEEEIVVVGAPRSWSSLIYYLGGRTVMARDQFPGDEFVPLSGGCYEEEAEKNGRLRELVEHHSTLRPELVDALYKSDMVWKTVNRRHQTQKEFNVTCNGSFFRPEVLDYINNILPQYKPEKTKCVLCPCAADKPYPAPLHTAILEVIPPDYELIIATGVLGLVPQKLWDVMPLYDSGVPYQWRLMNLSQWFFSKNLYDRVVVYSDFYASALHRGLKAVGNEITNDFYVFGYDDMDYLDLLSPENLAKLKAECERCL